MIIPKGRYVAVRAKVIGEHVNHDGSVSVVVTPIDENGNAIDTTAEYYVDQRAVNLWVDIVKKAKGEA